MVGSSIAASQQASVPKSALARSGFKRQTVLSQASATSRRKRKHPLPRLLGASLGSPGRPGLSGRHESLSSEADDEEEDKNRHSKAEHTVAVHRAKRSKLRASVSDAGGSDDMDDLGDDSVRMSSIGSLSLGSLSSPSRVGRPHSTMAAVPVGADSGDQTGAVMETAGGTGGPIGTASMQLDLEQQVHIELDSASVDLDVDVDSPPPSAQTAAPSNHDRRGKGTALISSPSFCEEEAVAAVVHSPSSALWAAPPAGARNAGGAGDSTRKRVEELEDPCAPTLVIDNTAKP